MTVIEGNTDASDQCYDLASREIRAGNFEKAEKLLNKALKLYPSNKRAELLLEKLKAGDFNKSSASPTGSDNSARRRPTTAPPKPEEPKLGEDYTAQQLEMVTKLKK
jgi:tetratricopeptide (TPR) repeat protein